MTKAVISTPDAPPAAGPYSQAISANGLVFCSGQIPADPKTGELIEGSIDDQTRRCMKNLAAVLRAAGSSLEKVVKVNVYLSDIADWPEFNDAYETFFTSDPPARAAIGVGALPKGASVEVECVALAS